MRLLGQCCFAASVVAGRDEGGRTCSNGLPVMPASVRMCGRFRRLESLSHRHLCQYVELQRCCLAPNTVTLISESYEVTLSDEISILSFPEYEDVAYQICSAVLHLHNEGIYIGTLRPRTVLLNKASDKVHVTISEYGVSHLTSDGFDMIGELPRGRGLAPEHLFQNSVDHRRTTSKTDVWALGIILLELMVGVVLDSVWSQTQYLAVLKTSLRRDAGEKSLMDSLVEALQRASPNIRAPSGPLVSIVTSCLMAKPSLRPTVHSIYVSLSKIRGVDVDTETDDGEFVTIEQMEAQMLASGEDWKLTELPLSDAFFLWKLCGSTVESILLKNGVIKLQHPVNTTPNLVIEDFRMYGNESGRTFGVACESFRLPMANLRQKILSLDADSFLHSVELDGLPTDNPQLSVVIKEKDVAYQLSRTRLVRHLVYGRAVHEDLLPKAVASDIPPMVRGNVWSSLLGVRDCDYLDFFELDTLAEHTSDRQLDVDIPRCHQYEELMTSPAAHWKLRRLIKGWLLSQPEYVYWQGCDSLAAPFLLLHFNRPATALASLKAFIEKYLHNFFLKDNSAIIQEYLAVFNHLLAYVDSALFSRLLSLDFYPELFAIPWFLTCFSHVLPLHKLFHVWDVLLLKDSSFPLFIGLAILRQLRPRLIEASFNDAILLFSDLPDLCMERVVTDSLMFYNRVPPSCAFRSHGNPANQVDPTSEEPWSLPCSVSPVPHHELRNWSCPRLSVEEFVWRVQRQLIAVIDIRSQSEFQRGSVLRSISYSNPSDPSLFNIAEVLRVAQRNLHPICVVSGKDAQLANKFTAMLVERGTDGVCVLDGGFEMVRNDRSIIVV